jgi:hypothetical protein
MPALRARWFYHRHELCRALRPKSVHRFMVDDATASSIDEASCSPFCFLRKARCVIPRSPLLRHINP